jgi:hypothetical protein
LTVSISLLGQIFPISVSRKEAQVSFTFVTIKYQIHNLPKKSQKPLQSNGFWHFY